MAAMPRYVHVVDGLVLFTFFVLGPGIGAAIGYFAWKGKPRGFDRSIYALGFILAVISSVLLMVYAQQLQADVRTLQFAWQIACFELAALLFGVVEGCVAGLFAYRGNEGKSWVHFIAAAITSRRNRRPLK